jgi:hypothetical protein
MAAIDQDHMEDDMVITTLAAIVTDTIAPKSMLRVIVNSERYTAVIMKDGRVLEVKGPRPSQIYDTPILWAESLQAPLEQVIVSGNEEEPKDSKELKGVKKEPKEKKEKKAKKPKKEKPHVCDVPKTNEAAARWMRHVHAMMVEAEVNKTPQIIDHYNELVAYLRTQAGAIWTNTPMASVRYSTGIEVASTTYAIQGIYLYYDQTTPFPRRQEICIRIMELYTPLFTLIKDKVLPFMKRKNMYHTAVRQVERLKKDLIKSHERIEIEERDYKARMVHYYNHAKALQSDLDVQEEIVKKYA